MNSVGYKVKQLRKEKNITQQQLAEGLTNRSYISQIEKGIVNPSLKTLRKICERLNCEIEDLFDDSENEILKLDIKNQLSTLEYLILENEFSKAKEVIKILEDNFESLNKNDLALYYFCKAKLEKNLKHELQAAIPFFVKSIELYNLEHFSEEKMRSVNELVSIYIDANELTLAFKYLDNAYEESILQKTSGVERIKLYINLGIAHAKTQEYRSAIRYLKRAIETSQRTKVFVKTGQAYMVLGLCYKKKGGFNESLAAYNKSIDFFKVTNDQSNLANAYTNLGILYRVKREFETSIQHLLISNELLIKVEDKFGILNSVYELAISSFYLQDYKNVLDLFSRFNKELYKGFSTSIIIKFNVLVGDTLLAQTNIENAINYYKNAYMHSDCSVNKQQEISYYVAKQLNDLNEAKLLEDWCLFVVKESKAFKYEY